MDEDRLRRLLRARPLKPGQPGWRCRDEAQLAAFVEGRLAASDQARLESHLADCGACLEQVAFLLRQPADAASEVPGPLLARARDLVPPARSLWRAPLVRWGALTAATASVVLAVGIFRLQSPLVPPVPVAPATSPAPAGHVPDLPAQPATPAPAAAVPAPQTAPVRRNPATEPLALHLLSPAENATIPLQDLEFHWRAVPNAAYYEAQVVTDEGNVAWSARTDTTEVRMPDDGASLQSGKTYFVWIRAYLTGGGTLKSAAVSFRIADR